MYPHSPTLLLMNLGLPEILLIGVFIGLFGLFLWALIHCVRNPRLNSSHKLLWVIAILVFPLFGSGIYLVIRPVSSELAGQGVGEKR